MHDGFIGRNAPVTKVHTLTIPALAGSYSIGHVLSLALHELSCPAFARGGVFRVHQVNVYEDSANGTQIKASVRLHFFRFTYTPPTQAQAFAGPDSPVDYLGFIDIDTSVYTEVSDGTNANPDYALATKTLPEPLRLISNDDQNVAFALVEIREAKTYGTANMTIEIHTEKI